MEETSILPTIAWKLQYIAGVCKLKSAPFVFAGTKWKLKLYCKQKPNGYTLCIILKRLGEAPNILDFMVDSVISRYNGFMHSEMRRKIINSTDCNEWCIWEQNTKKIVARFGECEFYLCKISPGSMWINNNVQEKESEELQNSCTTSLCYDFERIFNNRMTSDVTLVCGDQKFYVHKFILSVRSDVFAAMFQSDMRECREGEWSTDVEPCILKELLLYMYSGKCPSLTAENASEMYIAADKYSVQALKMKCGELMVQGEVVTDVETVKNESSSCSVLKDSVLSHFANIKEVINSREWKKLSEAEPKFAHDAFIYFVNSVPSNLQ